jgi:DNA polymerase-3 subunit epsilon
MIGLLPEQELLLKQDLVFVDLETTGFDPLRDRVVEVGVVRISGGVVKDTYNTLVNPNIGTIPNSVERITGIKPAELSKAPKFSDIKDDLFSMLRNAIFVAHNVDFDYGFVESEFDRHGMSYSSARFCTVKLSRELYPDFISHNLDSISQRFNIQIDSRHRAMDDALATYEFFKISHTKLGADMVQQAIIKHLKEAKPRKVKKVAQSQMSLV